MIDLENDTLLAGVTALALCWAAWNARRGGGERRDVGLLTALAALCLVGTGATLLL